MKKSLMSFEKCSDANLIPYFSWPYIYKYYTVSLLWLVVELCVPSINP